LVAHSVFLFVGLLWVGGALCDEGAVCEGVAVCDEGVLWEWTRMALNAKQSGTIMIANRKNRIEISCIFKMEIVVRGTRTARRFGPKPYTTKWKLASSSVPQFAKVRL
jgi:hypothetical protein